MIEDSFKEKIAEKMVSFGKADLLGKLNISKETLSE